MADTGGVDKAVCALVQGMNTGQYLLLATALRQLGGEMRIELSNLSHDEQDCTERIKVEADDHEAVLRLLQRSDEGWQSCEKQSRHLM